MHRIDTATAQKDKFGAGKNGFTRGNPQTGTPATDLDDDYFDMIQEELCRVVEESGEELDKGKHDQLLTALRALLLSRSNPFGDIASDGPEAIATALVNLQLGEAAKVSLGVDQNYVNVTSSRQSGVVYTNSTGKPILVSVSIVSEQNKSPNTLLVNGIEVASCGVSPVAGVYSTSRGALVAVVGNGKTYQISGSGTIISWSELR
ncbi:hypothetical protein [Citrobacter amalonaticus]|uniref:hypothetical protein n=1 Tax=Citrobacter amalonaticus TaxID=35703 RepID=UPI0020A2B8F9|nr:hypothetical protein [Citrobacter amalonaticus]